MKPSLVYDTHATGMKSIACLCILLLVGIRCLFMCWAEPATESCPVSRAHCEAHVHPSSVECKPATGSLGRYTFAQSCLYHHLYFIKGLPTLFFTRQQHGASFETMMNRDDFTTHFRPTIIISPSVRALCATHCLLYHDDLSVLGDFWLGNIGHATWDTLYPVFVSLMEYSHRHLLPFRLINIRKQRDLPFIMGVADQTAPLGLVYKDEFIRGTHAYQLREVLVPNFARCMSCTSDAEPIHYGMPMGYELDAIRGLRGHLLKRFGLPPSPPRPLQPLPKLHAIAIDNKRFTEWDRALIRSALASGPRLEGRMIEWQGMAFRDQLQLLSSTQIHMSGVGTACINQPFLPDGAIHINLGSCRRHPYQEGLYGRLFFPSAYTDPAPGYMDQPIVGSTPYHRALYYPLHALCDGLSLQHLTALLSQAVQLHDSRFPIPVPRGLNLAPTGRLVQDLMRRDPVFRVYISDPVAHKDCATGRFFWPEIVLNPHGPWGEGRAQCKLNVSLRAQLLASLEDSDWVLTHV